MKLFTRSIVVAAVAGAIAAIVVFLWLSAKPDSFRTNATLVVLADIRTPQESVQYLADLDGALRAQPVIQATSIATGVPEKVIKAGLSVSRVGSSSTVRLTYRSESSDPVLAESVIENAAQEANDFLNRSRDAELEREVASTNRSVKVAREQVQQSEQELAEFIEENGERDIARLALVEERLAADLRVRLVSANAAVEAARREATRLRIAADASPTNLEAEAAARAAETLLTDNTAVAQALQVELELAESSLDLFSSQAREQAELQENVDRDRDRLDLALLAAEEASFAYSSRGPSFAVEFGGGTTIETGAADAAQRAVIAGVSVAALLGLAGMWWRSAVDPALPERPEPQTARAEVASLPEGEPPMREIAAQSVVAPESGTGNGE